MIRIATRFAYDFAEPSDVLLQVEAAAIPEQTIVDAHIDVSLCEHFARVAAHDMIGERIWLRVTGRFTVDYRATVRIDRELRIEQHVEIVDQRRWDVRRLRHRRSERGRGLCHAASPEAFPLCHASAWLHRHNGILAA